MKSERDALLLSTVAALIIGTLALVVGLETGSGAILLDGAFNLCFFGTALLTLRVARLLQRPDDARYPFGYVQFEPLINMVKGLLILGVGFFALIDAGLSLNRGGSDVSAGLALGYAAFALVVCAAVLLLMRRAATRLASPLIQGDVDNWLVNTAISVGMLFAFLLAIILSHLGWSTAARFVDPVLVILVVLLTIGVPIRMAWRGLMALLKRAPDDAVGHAARAIIVEATRTLAPREIFVRVLQPGRTTYVLAHVLLGEGGGAFSAGEADQYRARIISALAERCEPVVADILFTNVPEFAQATTGFRRSDPISSAPARAL